MARSTWKFLFITSYDLYAHFKTQIKQDCPNIFKPNIRAKTLNKWNYRSVYSVPQGKYRVNIRPSLYHIGYKLGAFAKTRKPFFFRSKKKK